LPCVHETRARPGADGGGRNDVVRRINVEELKVLRPERVTYIGSLSKVNVSGPMGSLKWRLRASWPLGNLLVTQDQLVFSLGLGVLHLVRPWLLDRVDVQFFNSGGATV
jgi:hypothetical protein